MQDDIPELVHSIPTTNEKKIPITLITGFLGAGKTTFLDYILSNNGKTSGTTTGSLDKKIAVIQNEFGSKIGLEEAMIVQKGNNDRIEWIEFPNGCLCCTAKGDMLLAIENLVNRNPNLDAIFIETDGLADPEPLIRSFWVDSDLESTVYLDGVICIVDAVNFLIELGFGHRQDRKNEAYRQVALADVVLINKGNNNCTDIEKILYEINPLAKCYLTSSSHSNKFDIPLEYVIDINAYGSSDLSLKYDKLNYVVEHDLEVISLMIETVGSVTIEKVNQWLASFLWEQNTNTIYRVKGVLNVHNEKEKHNLQAVMQTFSIEPSGVKWDPQESRKNKIVIIGKGVDRILAQKFCTECIV